MHLLRSTSLRYLGVLFCLLTSLVSWQASAADQAQLDHARGIDHSTHQHNDNDNDDGHDHQGHDHQGNHHCPNCSAHLVGLTSSIPVFTTSLLDSYQDFVTNHSLIGAEAPPTPPPNS